MPELFDILTVTKDSRTDILNVTEIPAFVEVGNITQAGVNGAVYELCLSINTTFADINDSIVIEYSFNGNPPRTYSKEPKDNGDINPFYYAFPYTHSGTGNITAVVGVGKTAGGAQLDVLFADTWIKRIG